MRKLIVGIASYEDMKKRTLAIAKGLYVPKRGDPKVWFTSVESFAKVLSERNIELLSLIAEHQPESLGELAELSGRAKPSLSRTLKTMERYGLVRIRKGYRRSTVPHAIYTDVELRMPLRADHAWANVASAK